jgi:hypothetical protein
MTAGGRCHGLYGLAATCRNIMRCHALLETIPGSRRTKTVDSVVLFLALSLCFTRKGFTNTHDIETVYRHYQVPYDTTEQARACSFETCDSGSPFSDE